MFFIRFSRITDKKEKSTSENTLQQRLTKSSSHSLVSKSNSNPIKTHQHSAVSSVTKDRNNSSSDCSSTSVPSRKNSEVRISEEKPEVKAVKETQDTPPKRQKRKPHDISRGNSKSNLYQEPLEPKIVTEEISDPWEKQKLRHDHDDEKHSKNRKRSKANQKKDTHSIHPGLEKKNSNGSSAGDDEEHITIPKPFGFTFIEHRARLKKTNSFPPPSGHSMDKLDEISLNGPKPDMKDYPRKTQKTGDYMKTNKQQQQQRTKKSAFHQEKERLMMDTPTSPHAIAAAIFDAALVKKSQQKKKDGKKSALGKVSRASCSSSSSDLSTSSRSSSHTSIASEGKEKARSATPSGFMHGKCSLGMITFFSNLYP